MLGDVLAYLARVVLDEVRRPPARPEYGWESQWSRARHETTELANERAILFGFLTLGPSAALGVIAAVLTDSSPVWVQIAAGFAGAILGFALAVSLIFCVKAIALVPLTQRNEARAERDQLAAEEADVDPMSGLEELIHEGNQHLNRVDWFIWKGIGPEMRDDYPEPKEWVRWMYRAQLFIHQHFPYYGPRIREIWDDITIYVVRDLGVLSNVDVKTMQKDMLREFELLVEIRDKERS